MVLPLKQLSKVRDMYYTYYLDITFSLAAVDDDILWLDPLLEHALFWMLASTPKQAWRLDLEVANALFVVV